MLNKMILSMFILLSIGNAQEIEGRWIPGGFSNTMYEFVDTEPFAEAGLRYTYYCDDYSNACDSAYWNSLDTSDAIPNPKPYWVDGNTLIIDLFYGNEATYTIGFRCDGEVVDFYYDEDDLSLGLHSTMYREGFDDFNNDCLDANVDDCLCTEEWDPVCGIDGNTYSNACFAECVYVVIAYEGECQEVLEECFDFTGIEFGMCTMVLGVGLLNGECTYISGCDWTIDGIEYLDLFFDSIEECQEICGSNDECYLTTDDILGPYYFEDAPFRSVIAHGDEPGERLFISGVIKQDDCELPISGSLIEIWQANDEGCYGIVEDCNTGNPDDDYFNLRGKLFSDANGYYNFESILPGYYGSRPRHIHIKVTTPNEQVLISQLYFGNDPFCEDDQWCHDADDRIISLTEDDFGLNGEMDLIMNSSDDGIALGDINFDDSLNVQDIILLVGMILNDFDPSDFQIYSGDINNDNNIDILDIVQLVNQILNP